MTGCNSPIWVLGFFFSHFSPSDVEFEGVGSIPQANVGQQFVGQSAGQQYDFFVFIWFNGGLKSFVREYLKCRR